MLVIALVASINIHAEERINLGAIELGKEYALADFKNYIGTFTAPKTGVVTCSSTTIDVLYPYIAELEDMYTEGNEIPVTYNSLYGQRSYDFSVEEGKTYYMYAQFIMSSGTKVKFTMAESQSISLTGTTPADGIFHVSNSGQIGFDFDKAVSVSGATISCNGASKKITPQVSVAGVFFDVKSIVWGWYIDGTGKEGDTFTITMNGVCMAANKDILYGGDGVLEANFKLGPKPITLVSEDNVNGPFLSYYSTTNPAGIISLSFSGALKEGATAVLKYGDIDKDADGDYYVENLPVSIEGNVLSINLQGKRRRAIDMVTSGTNYEQVVIGVTGVFDVNGNYAYANGTGSLGSYWYSMPFQEVSTNVFAEFTPANGADINNTKTMEIWVTDEHMLSYSGILFTYEKDGEEKSVLVTNYKKEADPDDESATIITLSIPDEVKNATNVVVTFKDLTSADGSDYSNVLRSKYNAFIISRTTPVANGTHESLKADAPIKIYTNKDASIDRLLVSLTDLNPAEGESGVLLEGDATKLTKGFELAFERDIRLVVGHDYRLTATAYNAKGEIIGSDYIIYHGAASAYRYSDYKVESITPAEGSTLSTTEDNEFTIVFDGLMLINEETYMLTSSGTKVPFEKIEAVSPDEDGYANTWKLLLPAASVKGSEMTLHLVAFDLSGRRLEGNTDKEDLIYTAVKYSTGTVVDLAFASLTPAEGESLKFIPDFFMTFTSPEQVGYGWWQVVDLDATDADYAVLYTGQIKKQADGSWKAHPYFDVEMLEGHTYQFEVYLYDSEESYNYDINVGENILAVLKAQYKGATKAYEYSPVYYVSASPIDQSVLSSVSQNEITITFDSAVETIEAEVNLGLFGSKKCEVSASEDKTQWVVTVPQSILEEATGSFNIVIVAKDAEGRIVKGNQGEGDNSVINLTYLCYLGAPAFAITPEDGTTVESIQTVVASYEQGINISGSCEEPIRIKKDGVLVTKVFEEDIVVSNLVGENYTTASFTLPTPLTEAGTYTITFPTTFFMLGNQFDSVCNKEQSITLTIPAADAINTVITSSDKKAYNLRGMRVSDTEKGIVIINGKKFLKH